MMMSLTWSTWDLWNGTLKLSSILQKKKTILQKNAWEWSGGCGFSVVISQLSFPIFLNGRPKGRFKAERGLRRESSIPFFLCWLVIPLSGYLIQFTRWGRLRIFLWTKIESNLIIYNSHMTAYSFVAQDTHEIENFYRSITIFESVSGLKINHFCTPVGFTKVPEKTHLESVMETNR